MRGDYIMINKYLALALSAFYLSNLSIATDINMEEENKQNSIQPNIDHNLYDGFKDEEQQKRFLNNKGKMEKAVKRAEKRLGLDKKEKESQKK